MLEVKSRFNGKWLRPLYRAAIRRLIDADDQSPVRKWLIRILLEFPGGSAEKILHLPHEHTGFVLAKTPKFEFPLALVGAASGVRTVFMGQPKRLTPGVFDVLVSTPSTPTDAADIRLEVLPGKIIYRVFREARKQLRDKERNEDGHKYVTWSLLVGGNANGYDFGMADWKALVAMIKAQSERTGCRWLISTSPRTPQAVEQLLQDELSDSPYVAGLYLWNHGQKADLLDMLVRSDMVFVSEESASMVSEAINTRLPVVVFHPIQLPRYNSLVTDFVTYHARKGSICRLSSDALQNTFPECWANDGFAPVEECWHETVRAFLVGSSS